jgi:hypothetical protein
MSRYIKYAVAAGAVWFFFFRGGKGGFSFAGPPADDSVDKNKNKTGVVRGAA